MIKDFLEDLVIVGAFSKVKDKILILDDLDGKKKLGAAKAVAELRNKKIILRQIGKQV